MLGPMVEVDGGYLWRVIAPDGAAPPSDATAKIVFESLNERITDCILAQRRVLRAQRSPGGVVDWGPWVAEQNRIGSFGCGTTLAHHPQLGLLLWTLSSRTASPWILVEQRPMWLPSGIFARPLTAAAAAAAPALDSTRRVRHLLRDFPLVAPHAAERVCSVCAEPTSRHCGGCLYVMYCSSTCQRADWARHRPFCHFIRNVEG